MAAAAPPLRCLCIALPPPLPPARADSAAASVALEQLRVEALSAVERLGPFAPRHADAAARAVDFSNRHVLVAYLRSAAVRRGHSAAFFEALYSGLGAVLPAELLPLFTPPELEALFCGTQTIDVGLLKTVAKYEFCSAADPHIVAFWSVLEGFTQAQRAAFVNFVSARSRLPASADAFLQVRAAADAAPLAPPRTPSPPFCSPL